MNNRNVKEREGNEGSPMYFTLRFVDGHRKARADGELDTLKLEREVCWDHGNSWYEDILAC